MMEYTITRIQDYLPGTERRLFTCSYCKLNTRFCPVRSLCSFLVSLLEQGKVQYGVGTERQMCVLLDRAGTVYRNGKKKIEKFDMGVIPNLLELFRHMYSTFTVRIYVLCGRGGDACVGRLRGVNLQCQRATVTFSPVHLVCPPHSKTFRYWVGWVCKSSCDMCPACLLAVQC